MQSDDGSLSFKSIHGYNLCLNCNSLIQVEFEDQELVGSCICPFCDEESLFLPSDLIAFMSDSLNLIGSKSNGGASTPPSYTLH